MTVEHVDTRRQTFASGQNRGTQSHTAHKCISRSELIRVLKIVLDGISQSVRAFTDEVRIQPLAVDRYLLATVADWPLLFKSSSFLRCSGVRSL